jgi:hypothetical protein
MTSGFNCGRWSGQGATVTVFVLLGLWVFWFVAGALVWFAEDTRGVSDLVVLLAVISCVDSFLFRGVEALAGRSVVLFVLFVCWANCGGEFHETFCWLECRRW